MTENQPEQSFTLLKDILEFFPDGVFTHNHQGIITYVNPAFCQLLGYQPNELIGTEIQEHVPDLVKMQACRLEVEKHGFCRDQETVFKRKDGTLVHISKNVQRLTDEQGRDGILVSIRDLSELHQLNNKLTDSKIQLERYNQNLSNMVLRRTQTLNEQMAFLTSYKKAIDASSLVSKCSIDKRVLAVNDALCIRSGYRAEELIGQSCSFLWSEESKKRLPEITDQVLRGEPWKGVITLHTKSAKLFYLEACIVPICNESGELFELVNISHDITPLIETTKALSERLHFDRLTDLPNRVKLLSDIERSEQQVHLVLINIDSFNEINAYYGHFIADQLLRVVGLKLVHLLQAHDARVYKLPIDEFAILIKGTLSRLALESLVEKTLLAISHRSFKVGLEQINITMSAGLASTNEAGVIHKDTLVAADMALKTAKMQRKPWIYFEPKLNIKQGYENNLVWIKRLRSAMDEDRLIPFYQPVVNAKTLKVDYYECLVRIVEIDGEVISPFHFLDVAKKLKLYLQLTRIVIEKAFAQFADQKHTFSINLSIEDINDNEMRCWIIDKLATCGFAQRVIFEIVESEGIQNYELVNEFIKDVKRHGARIAIDDFGAGYSNFVYIMRLDIDFIKIDGSIIRNITRDKSSQVIADTIIDFARKLNIQTVAEFVSDQAVYDYMKKLPVDSLQGYWFGEPKPTLEKP